MLYISELHIEFLVAFGIYRDIICSVYLDRRQELNASRGGFEPSVWPQRVL